MLSVSSQKLADYRAGAVPIMTFGHEYGHAPAASGYGYSYDYGNDGVFSRQMAALSYESGLGRGFGKGSAMTSIVDMTVTELNENDVFGDDSGVNFAEYAMWMGFTNKGSDWKSQRWNSEWVRIGDHFLLYRPKAQSSLTKLKCKGVLAQFDKSVSLKSNQRPAKTIAEGLADLLPCTVAVFLERLCDEAYVSLYSTNFTSSSIEIRTNPFTNNSNVTCRDVLDWILDMTGCYVRVKYVDGTSSPREYNQIELFSLLAGDVKPLVNIVNMQCSNYDIYIPEVTVEGDGWSVTKTSSKSGVYDRRSLTLEACPLLECLGSTTMSRTVAGYMAQKWVGQTLCEFEIDLASGWVYEPGDCVSFKDVNDKTRYGWITYVKHTMGGVTRIKCELAS